MMDEDMETDDFTYLHDDVERERDGVHPTPFTAQSEEARARRNELERQLETLIRDTESWLQDTDDDDAEDILRLMQDLYEMLGNPPEDTG
jgi:vacuolar-type H+-ATPase subunit E/Vma4